MKKKQKIAQFECVLQLIDALETQDEGMVFILYVALDDHLEDEIFLDFRRVLWSKLYTSKYSVNVGLIEKASIVRIEDSVKNSYFIHCCRRRWLRRRTDELILEHQVNISMPIFNLLPLALVN